MQHFYDGQIRRYITQIIRLLSNFTIKTADGNLIEVPVVFGDPDRSVASILRKNSENSVVTAPKISVHITGLDLDRSRLGDSTYVNKLNIRERAWDADGNEYLSTQGANYTIERIMPTPFKLTVEVSIWSTNTDQKLQMFEQILVLFNPSLEIQTTSNYIDWTSLSVVDIDRINFSSRSIPVGTDSQIDVAGLTLTTPIYLSPPAKVKKLGVVTDIIHSMFQNDLDGKFMGSQLTNIGGFGIYVEGGKAEILSSKGDVSFVVQQTGVKVGPDIPWEKVLDQYPGQYRAGVSKLYLKQANGTEVSGTTVVNPLDTTELMVTWDPDTYPTNTDITTDSRPNSPGTFDAIIDPKRTTGPFDKIVGRRYLLTDVINPGEDDIYAADGSILFIETGVVYDEVYDYSVKVDGVTVPATAIRRPNTSDGFMVLRLSQPAPQGSMVTYKLKINADGPDAWKSNSGEDLYAVENDIIEWDGEQWNVVFDASKNTENLIYQTNIYTGVQYKWDGVQWAKSFEGEYGAGQWRLEL